MLISRFFKSGGEGAGSSVITSSKAARKAPAVQVCGNDAAVLPTKCNFKPNRDVFLVLTKC